MLTVVTGRGVCLINMAAKKRTWPAAAVQSLGVSLFNRICVAGITSYYLLIGFAISDHEEFLDNGSDRTVDYFIPMLYRLITWANGVSTED